MYSRCLTQIQSDLWVPLNRLADAPEDIRETTRSVSRLGTRAQHRISNSTENRNFRDQNDPGEAHALHSLIVNLEVPGDEIGKWEDAEPKGFPMITTREGKSTWFRSWKPLVRRRIAQKLLSRNGCN